MKYKAVLFDLDGTLLDTIEDLADSMNSVLDTFGFPVHTTEDYKYFVGDGMDKLVYRTLPESERNEKTIKKCFSAMKNTYDKKWCEKTLPYKGIPEMLDGLTVKGLKLTILSNKPDDFTKMIVDKLLSKWEFYPVLGAREGVPKKPDPCGAFEITRELNFLPEDFLYLGDTGVDMQTANRSGMHPVGVLWGFRKADELNENGAKILISSPMDVFTLL